MERLVGRVKLLLKLKKVRRVRVAEASWGFSLTPSSPKYKSLGHGLPIVSFGSRTAKWYLDLGNNGDLAAAPKEALSLINHLKSLIRQLNKQDMSLRDALPKFSTALIELAEWYLASR